MWAVLDRTKKVGAQSVDIKSVKKQTIAARARSRGMHGANQRMQYANKLALRMQYCRCKAIRCLARVTTAAPPVRWYGDTSDSLSILPSVFRVTQRLVGAVAGSAPDAWAGCSTIEQHGPQHVNAHVIWSLVLSLNDTDFFLSNSKYNAQTVLYCVSLSTRTATHVRTHTCAHTTHAYETRLAVRIHPSHAPAALLTSFGTANHGPATTV